MLSDSLEIDSAEGTLRYVPGARGSKWYNLDTHRFAALPTVGRYTYGINFVFHRAYYGATVQGWSLDSDLLQSQQGFLYETLLDHVGEFVHADPSEFWFDVSNVGDGTQEIPFTPDLIEYLDTYTVEVTDERGTVILEDEGDL